MTDDTHHTGAGGATEATRAHEPAAACPSVTLTEAVAAATDREMTDLPPLADSVDPDALDALLTRSRSPVTVSFGYAGVSVSAFAGDTLEVRVVTDDD